MLQSTYRQYFRLARLMLNVCAFTLLCGCTQLPPDITLAENVRIEVDKTNSWKLPADTALATTAPEVCLILAEEFESSPLCPPRLVRRKQGDEFEVYARVYLDNGFCFETQQSALISGGGEKWLALRKFTPLRKGSKVLEVEIISDSPIECRKVTWGYHRGL